MSLLEYASNPAVIGLVSATILPTAQDALVAWTASPRVKVAASILLSAVLGVVMTIVTPGEAEAVTDFLEAIGVAYTGGYLSFKAQKNLAEGTEKPTPLAVAPRFGIGAGSHRYEGD